MPVIRSARLRVIVWFPGTTSIDAPPVVDMVPQFKSITSARYAAEVNAGNWASFDGRLWQRNFYDHIVRNQDDLDRCERYIQTNPANWATDIDRDPDRPGGPTIDLIAASLADRNPS